MVPTLLLVSWFACGGTESARLMPDEMPVAPVPVVMDEAPGEPVPAAAEADAADPDADAAPEAAAAPSQAASPEPVAAPVAAAEAPAVVDAPTPEPAEAPPATEGDEAAMPEEPASPPPRRYTLDARKSRLYVLVRYERGGLGGALGHDHVVVATGWSGSVVWDEDDPSACDVRIDVPVTGLQVDPGSARSWAGFEGDTSDKDKASITDNLRGKKQLEASRFPSIEYRSTSCAADGTVKGSLAIRGVSQTVAVPMRITVDGDQFRARGSFSKNHSDFGFSPFRALAGALRNQDRLEFVIDVRGGAK